MRKILSLALLFALLLAPSAFAQGTTRALLIACSEFDSMPDLGSAISGNLHMIGSALVSADTRLGRLSIEDGTIGTAEALENAVHSAFAEADEEDLSILYLCTHGVLSSTDDGGVYLLLGDGQTESALSPEGLYSIISGVQGEKLLIIDACYSGALIGRGMPGDEHRPGSVSLPPVKHPVFLSDPSVHVLTSSSGSESSWYYDSEHLSTGAVSYFASALASGLGLYGSREADLSGDGTVTLEELHRHLNNAVPSSASQLLSTRAGSIILPSAQTAALARPLTGFSYGPSLLTGDDPVLEFSFTVTQDHASVQYRLVDFDAGAWNWENAKIFRDEGENESGTLSKGRKTRALSLHDILPEESGYLMLQVFSVAQDSLTLCSERLIAVQGESEDKTIAVSCPDTLDDPGMQELPIDVRIPVPAELTLSVYDSEGVLVRRIASGMLTRPTGGEAAHLYWDGRDACGIPVTAGSYVIAAEARIGGVRQKATKDVTVGF